jgi:transposase-like protein
LIGTFGAETISVPRARVESGDGKTMEWRSKALPRYQRLTKKAEALIAAVYLAGTNTRREKRALYGLFQGAVSKDVVSRAWRKVKVDWDAWVARDLADEDIVRLILDGTVIKTRLDRKATNISVLAAIGVRRDGQKVLLSIKSEADQKRRQWRVFPPNGRRKQSCMGHVPRRSRCARSETTGVCHRRRCPRPGGSAGRALG